MDKNLAGDKNVTGNKADTAELPHYDPPELHLDLGVVSTQYRQLQLAFQASPTPLPPLHVHYAVKANPHAEVITHLHRLGCGFEIASAGELALLQSLGIEGNKIIFSNPVKPPQSIVQAVRYGVQWFSFDSREELEKLVRHAPDSRYCLRIATPKINAVCHLSSKFGADEATTEKLLNLAAAQRLNLAGITFHVGSQALTSEGHRQAIEYSHTLLRRMQRLGLKPQLLNLGGGFPCQIGEQLPSIADFVASLHPALADLQRDPLLPGLQLATEPGRLLIASAGTLHCQIIGTSLRRESPADPPRHWAYLDCGFYQGLIEFNDPFGFTIQSERKGPLQDWVIAGPTCDSIDRFTPLFPLPESSRAGDRLQIPHLGAYSTACSSDFNGFPPPRIRIIPDNTNSASGAFNAYTYSGSDRKRCKEK